MIWSVWGLLVDARDRELQGYGSPRDRVELRVQRRVGAYPGCPGGEPVVEGAVRPAAAVADPFAAVGLRLAFALVSGEVGGKRRGVPAQVAGGFDLLGFG